MFVVIHYLEPVALFHRREDAELLAGIIGADVYEVPVLEVAYSAQAGTDGD